MTFRIVRETEAPKRGRKSVARFEATPEWQDLRAKLAVGLNPQEAIVIQLTEDDKRKYRIKSLRTCARFVQKYIRSRGLPYVVTGYATAEGLATIKVKHEPVISQTA